MNHIDHLIINTDNPERCVSFYTKKLGFYPDYGNNRIALKTGCHKINVHTSGSSFNPIAKNPTIGKIAFGLRPYVKPASLEQYGFEWDSLFPCDYGKFPENVSFIADPDMNIIRIGQCAVEKDADDIGIVCIFLAVSDVEASARFFQAFTGMEICRDRGTSLVFRHGRIWLLQKDLECIRGKISCGSGDFCLMANGDIENILDFLVKNKAPFENAPEIVSRHGATGSIDSIYLRDPDGNLIEISRPASRC